MDPDQGHQNVDHDHDSIDWHSYSVFLKEFMEKSIFKKKSQLITKSL